MKQLVLSLISALQAFLDKLEEKTEPKKDPKPKHSRNKRLLVFASKEIGVKEVQGSGDSARVVKYHAYAREDNDISKAQPDSTPWCASFICYCLEMVGMGSTNSMAARSYLKWGKSVKKDPLPGDIVVYWRGKKSGWAGHVGVYLGQVDGLIYTLGGNQRDAVNVSRYSTDKLLDIRRSSRMKKLSKQEILELKSLANRIINGHKVELGGKVV